MSSVRPIRNGLPLIINYCEAEEGEVLPESIFLL